MVADGWESRGGERKARVLGRGMVLSSFLFAFDLRVCSGVLERLLSVRVGRVKQS